jgi:hypothetical protein
MAKAMLERDGAPIQGVATAVGYDDVRACILTSI